jgi:hypothetical protein
MIFFLAAFLFCWRVRPGLGGGARNAPPLFCWREGMIVGKDPGVDLADQETAAATTAR